MDRPLPSDKLMNSGDSDIFLSCGAHGQPAPNITWLKDGDPIVGDDHLSVRQSEESQPCDSDQRCSVKVAGTLRWLASVRWTDKGVYTCQAFNGAGRPVNSSTSIRISHSPVIVNDPKRPWTGAEVDQPATIECRANANPAPTFRWFHASNEISNSPLYSVTEVKGDTNDLFSSSLTIRSPREEDLGDYKCLANNHLGDASYVFSLQKKTKPMAPTDVGEMKKNHNSILLGWLPGYNGGYDQTFLVEMTDKDGRLSSLNVSDFNSHRIKRHVGIETPRPVTTNITGRLINQLKVYQLL